MKHDTKAVQYLTAVYYIFVPISLTPPLSSPTFINLIILIYASLVNMAILSTKLKDKAKDGDSLVASVVPSAFVAVAGSYSQQMHTHAHELVYHLSPFLFFIYFCFCFCFFVLFLLSLLSGILRWADINPDIGRGTKQD